MRPFAPAALLAFLAALALAAQPPAKRPMTFADLDAMKRVSDPQISPSGKWVLFSVTDVSLERNSKTDHLWVVPLDGKAREAQATTGAGETGGRFSPDGKWVMYTAGDQLQIAAWDDAAGRMGPGYAVTALATSADGGIWAPDSRHFLFVSSVYPECQSHAPMGPQRNTEEARCNALKDTAAAKDPVKAQVFDHLLYRHWNAFVGPRHSHIFYASVDLGTNGKPAAPTDLTPASVVADHEAPTFSLGGPLGYAISPDGGEVAYEVNLDKVPAESTNNDIFVLHLGAEPSTAHKVSTSPGSDDGPQYSPNGKYLAWRSQARAGFESDKFDLVVMDRASEKPETIDIHLWHPSSETFTGSIDEFVWSPDTAAIVFSSAIEGDEAVFTVDIHSGTQDGHPTFVRNTVRGEYGDLRLVAPRRGKADRSFMSTTTLVATRMALDQPAEIVTASLGTIGHTVYNVSSTDEILTPEHGTDTFLTHLNEKLVASLDLPPAEIFHFIGAGTTKVEGFILRPPNFDRTKKYPLKFLIHGGPQGAWGNAWSYRWNPELFAAEGYVVVMINPRGSTGYGQQFVDEVSGDWGGRAFADLMRGLDYAEQYFVFIDTSRECALGASYGGYMANWVLTHTDRFKCIVSHDGMYNPQSAFGTTEELWFNEWEFRPHPESAPDHGQPAASNGQPAPPAHPWDFYDKPAAEDPFRKWSPMLAIRNAHTPTLVVHGQRDYRLDVSEGFQLFTALQLLGVPSKMLYFPDEGHWVLKPKNSELWYRTVNDWCDRWTGTNKYAGIGPETNPAAVPAAVPASLPGKQ